MKNNKKNFYILTISKNDPSGLLKTIKSVDNFKTDFKLIHLIKIFSPEQEFIENYESLNLKRIIINSDDSGIYNSMNKILSLVPLDVYSIFLNSGDTIKGNLKSKNIKSDHDFFLVDTYKKNYKKKNLIKIKTTYYDGMPFSHQSLIFRKKSGMYFDENYKICGDYEFALKWVKKKYKSPLNIYKINTLKTIFDINGISSKRKYQRDIEGYKVVLKNCGILKSLVYLTNRTKRYTKLFFGLK